MTGELSAGVKDASVGWFDQQHVEKNLKRRQHYVFQNVRIQVLFLCAWLRSSAHYREQK